MPNPKQAELARKNLEKRLSFLRDTDLTRPKGGWIRAIRDSLGMTSRQFSKRLNVSQSRITELERAEARGSTTLNTIKDAAEALNCDIVYALVPRKPLDEIVRERARTKAINDFKLASHNMLLENQSMSKDQMEAELERLTQEILSEPLNMLWDEA